MRNYFTIKPRPMESPRPILQFPILKVWHCGIMPLWNCPPKPGVPSQRYFEIRRVRTPSALCTKTANSAGRKSESVDTAS